LTAYVVDASVAAKWVLPSKTEPLAAEAIRLLDSYAAGRIHLTVPDLFWPEIGNILWKSVRIQRISDQSAHEAIGWLQSLGISTSPTRDLIKDAFSVATALDRTVYDAVYVSLAVATARTLVTADERLVNGLAGRFPVQWLASIV
jgi:predicted nucleic acid-binding protein